MSLSARVTWRSFQAGALRMVLPGLASLPFGIGFGVAAAQKGLSAFETTLMSFMTASGFTLEQFPFDMGHAAYPACRK